MNFSIRQRRAGFLLLLICSTVSLPAQENRRRFPELDKTPVAANTKPNIVLMLTDKSRLWRVRGLWRRHSARRAHAAHR
jgi:hypothetical protein